MPKPRASVDDAITEASEAIDGMCTPELMTKVQAVDFLEGVIEHCDALIAALRDDMSEDE
jgi:hypothetical protein